MRKIKYRENLEELAHLVWRHEGREVLEDLERILEAREGNPEALRIMESLPGLGEWVRKCHVPPSFEGMRRAAFNELLGGHGVEMLREDFGAIPFAAYVNQGDPYVLTVVWPMEGEDEGVPHILSWADYLEIREERREMREEEFVEEGCAP